VGAEAVDVVLDAAQPAALPSTASKNKQQKRMAKKTKE
jgi:hypothetical protein